VQSVLIKIIGQARDEVLVERTESLEANASSRAREFGRRHGQDTVARHVDGVHAAAPRRLLGV
jgi:hypothetical protein